MRTFATSSRCVGLMLVIALLASAWSRPADAQSCSGKCAYDRDAVKCVLSAFIHHTCFTDYDVCEEYPCILNGANSLVSPTKLQVAECSLPASVPGRGSVTLIKAVKLKARS